MIASPYFTFDELTRSQTATRKRIDNTPSPETIANLNQLVDNVLHPLREAFGQPVLISSGYRSPILNRAIGGSRSSDHCRGAAADLTVANISNRDVLAWIARNTEFKQLIDEFDRWIHVAYLDGAHRGQMLRARKRGRRTVYLAADFR